MRYIISNNVALRSWKLVPCACYVRGHQYAQKLSREQFELLKKCDGVQELEQTELLRLLERAGVVREARPGETWSEWSRPRSFGNRYFPCVNWAITGKCNFNCRHCFMAADNAPMLGEFSWEECVSFLDECERCGIQSVTLTGGEPMLHPRFRDIVREIARRGMYLVELNTNGSFLTADFLDELRALDMDTEIKLSFDGIGHHDWLRGVPHAEEKALRAIKLAKEKGFRVRSQTNVHRGNLDVMYDTIASAGRPGRGGDTPHPHDGDAPLAGQRRRRDPGHIRVLRRDDSTSSAAASRAAFRSAWTCGSSCVTVRASGTTPSIPCSRTAAGTRTAYRPARARGGTVAVSYTGEVYPCNQMSGTLANRGVSLGNVKTTALHELLERGEYLDTVTMPVSEIFEANEICRDCQYWRCCMGGCRAIALAFTGGYRHFDPAKCAFFKGGYMQKLDELFQSSPRPYTCLSETGPMERRGEPEKLPRSAASSAATHNKRRTPIGTAKTTGALFRK